MTIARTIANARTYLAAGNPGSYARVLSSAIRAAGSDRAANAYRAAIKEDGAEHHFSKLASAAPVAL